MKVKNIKRMYLLYYSFKENQSDICTLSLTMKHKKDFYIRVYGDKMLSTVRTIKTKHPMSMRNTTFKPFTLRLSSNVA